jgi:hypothetical protein
MTDPLEIWLDAQEEYEQRAEVLKAMGEARIAGLEVSEILTAVGEAVTAYRKLRALSYNRAMVDLGIVSEADAIIAALTKKTNEALKK